ncbi:MAG: DUF3375 family protein [Pleomorphochaeta sp.]
MIELINKNDWEIALFSDINLVKELINNDSGLTLLTKKDSPFIISFLYKMFKQDSNDNGIEQQYFVQKLASYLNKDNNFSDIIDDDNSYSIEIDTYDKALNLTKKWSSPENHFIFRYYNENNIEMIDLSTPVDRLFRYFEEIDNLKNMFVATESKFIEIIDRINELDQNTTTNPQARINDLQRQKAELEKEIKQIEETGEVQTFTHTQVSERINSLNQVSKSLIGDFKQLRDNNHKVFSELCKKQLENTENRGTILSHILDQTEELQRTPQAESFNSFWFYLSNREDKEAIKNKIERIRKKLPNQDFEKSFYDTFEETLYKSGKAILEENRLLSEKLQKIITKKTSSEYKYISSLTKEIKTLSVKKDLTIPYKDTILVIDGNADVNNDMARPLELINFQAKNNLSQYKKAEIPKIDLSQLVIDIYVNELEIKKNIENYYNDNKTNKFNFSIQEIINKYPIKFGLAETLTYLSIIYKSDWAKINDTESETIIFSNNDSTNSKISLSIPKVVIKK